MKYHVMLEAMALVTHVIEVEADNGGDALRALGSLFWETIMHLVYIVVDNTNAGRQTRHSQTHVQSRNR